MYQIRRSDVYLSPESTTATDGEPSLEKIEVDIYALPYFQASLFATVLEDFIACLRILIECNTSLRLSKLESDMGLLLALKYGVQKSQAQDELDGVDAGNLESDVYKINKLDADRRYLGEVLKSTYTDLSLSRSFRGLADHIYDNVIRDKHRADVQDTEAKNRVTRRELNRQFRQQRTHIKSVSYETDTIVEELKSRVEDSALNDAIRIRYVDAWQRARTEQHAQVISDTEYGPASETDYYKQKIDHEQRVHTEVEMFTNIVINETLQKVEHWMAKYEKDMEAIDLKIQIKKNDYIDMRDKRRELEETLEKHDKQMKDWIFFKEEREKARQYRKSMTKSAIIVQAWWRGIMVRQQLGPFKVKKKPKAKKQ